MASGGLGNLTVDLLLETVQWATGLDKAEHQAQKTADAIAEKFNKMAGNIGDTLKGVAAGIIAGFAVDKLASFVTETSKLADKFDELGQRVGFTAGEIAKLSVYADISGTSIDSMAGGMAKFNKAIVEANSNPNSQAARVFDALKVSLIDANGALKPSAQIYKETALAMGALKDSAIKTDAAIILAGKSGAESIPVWNAMYQATDKLKEATERYGDAMDKAAGPAGMLEESMAVMHINSKVLATAVGNELLPYFIKLTEQWTNASGAGTGLSTTAEAIVNAFKGIVIAADFVLTAIRQLITGVITSGKVLVNAAGGDWKGAWTAIKEGFADAGEMEKSLEERTNALLFPMAQATKVVKSTADASADLGKAVAKIPPFKLTGTRALEKLPKDLENINHGIREMTKLTNELEESIKKQAAVTDVIRGVEQETKMLGMGRAELEAYRKQQELLNAVMGSDNPEQYAEKLERLNRALADKQAKQDYIEFLNSIEGAWHSAFDAMFEDTKGGWEGMLNSLKASFKKLLLNYLYEAFAKPFFMQIVAGGAGPGGGEMSGTSSYINQLLGGGTNNSGLVSSIVNYFKGSSSASYGAAGGGEYNEAAGLSMARQGGGSSFSWTSNGYGAAGTVGAGVLGGLVGGWGAGQLGAGQRGVQAGTQYGSTLAAIGMQIYGPVGAAIGAALGIVIGKATDPDPDAMRKAMFGPTQGAEGLTKWSGQSAFGSFGFSRGEWLSDEQMGPQMDAFIKSITEIDNAFASFMTNDQIEKVKARLATLSKTYELGMEHGDVQNLGAILKDRISAITHEINSSIADFVDNFEGDAQDLVSVVGAYLSVTAGLDFDPDKIAQMAEAQKTQMELYQSGTQALNEYIAGMDTSAESMGGLVVGLQSFQEATVNMVLAIDAASKSIHEMFMSTADSIRMSMMTPEQKYKFLQDQTDELYKQLLTETDPAKIQALADKINKNITDAWNLLSPEQQAAVGEEYITRIDALDQTVADKFKGLRDVVIEDSKTMMDSIATKLAELFTKGDATAQTNAQSANTIAQAAATLSRGIPVYVADPAAVTGG